MTSADAIVLGGGPAGSAAALTLRAQGRSVVLLERARHSGPRPGECLHPGVVPLLTTLGVGPAFLDAGFRTHDGIWTAWDHPRRFVGYGADTEGPWHGFHAPRERFDALLLDAAVRRGVDVVRSTRARRPIVGVDGRVRGVLTDDGPIEASHVIDAAGGRHWLARGLRIPIDRASPKLVARYAYPAAEVSEDERLPSLTAVQEGWVWSARVDEQRRHWTRLGWGDDADKTVEPEGVCRGADVTWRIARRTAGPGWFMAGDAAMVLDPCSSNGILRALMTGMMAGHTALAIHSGGDPGAAALGYSQWCSAWFQDNVASLRELYLQHPTPPSWARGTLRWTGRETAGAEA